MQELTVETFEEAVIRPNHSCVVLFSKETCPLCQEVHPMLEEVEEEYAEQPVEFYHVDAEVHGELLIKLGLQGVPNVLFYRNGELYQRFSGFREFEEYMFMIDRMLEGK